MPMTPFERWADFHATKFGIRDEKELATLLSWDEDFRGVSAVLLTEATAWLAAHPEEFGACDARFQGKMVVHLRLLKHFVAQRKQRQTQVVADTGPPAPREEWFRLRNTMENAFALMPAEAKEERAGRESLRESKGA